MSDRERLFLAAITELRGSFEIIRMTPEEYRAIERAIYKVTDICRMTTSF